MNWKNLSKF